MSLAQLRKNNSLLKEEWQNFIKYDKQPVKVNRAILSSWQRCKRLGIDPYGGESTKILSSAELTGKLEQNENFLRVVKPYMDKMYQMIKGSGYVVFLTDNEGWVLYVVGDKKILRDFEDNLNFGIGVSWSEQAVGTTAVAMVLAEGVPVPFIAEEKYCMKLKERACSAVPIKDPEGKIIGVLGFAMSFQMVKKINCQIFGILVAAEMAIENHLLVMKTRENLHVISQYYKAVFDSVAEAVVTIDRKGIIRDINKSAGGLLSINHEQAVGRKASEILDFHPVTLKTFDSEKGCRNQEVILDSKRGKIFLNSIPILKDDGEIAGVIGVFREAKEQKNLASKNNSKAKFTFDSIIGNSREIQEVKRLANIAARESSNVLLFGESGTGKELFAQAIHNAGFRAEGPFIAVNCGAIPKELIESEFFGYEKGAFTGACQGGRPGKFELAVGGTIFLDEIGEMPKDLQVRLLRVLQEKEVTRLGGAKVVPVDVRVIAATNKDLSRMVAEGSFREDLYWRLNIISINIPPLSQRNGDIPLLIEYFLEKHSRKRGKKYSLSKNTREILLNYHWPGNVRELENALERAALFAENGYILPEHLPGYITTSKPQYNKTSTGTLSLEEAEKQSIQQALDISRGNLSQTAKILGIARNTLYCKMRKYQIGCYEN
ncbi:Acetoin dehydrogenase operon transcriptional activator AcoR [Pelotomaculum schinkii]|uniref:Acetoin dehydrogenase operon transcriptional activator AcoR n=1 Tax=Pelotomaculum schinkii TaxID=78350 RepID=A0A4Y7R8Z5_9FIRM|nr:sigma 54-interacting transcriptional regulator [Pelotomaculum schinkii]TEB05438.1 Acetoin dehydrogenase operon transcriptional activator AcoR [Pelotomaculum schinkii]